jgi:hypothetical protein
MGCAFWNVSQEKFFLVLFKKEGNFDTPILQRRNVHASVPRWETFNKTRVIRLGSGTSELLQLTFGPFWATPCVSSAFTLTGQLINFLNSAITSPSQPKELWGGFAAPKNIRLINLSEETECFHRLHYSKRGMPSQFPLVSRKSGQT